MMSTMPIEELDNSNVDTILTLPDQTGSMAIADDCRAAALAFLNESSHWGKAELAMWLMGPYGQLTQYVSQYSRRRSGEFARQAPLLREIDARMVHRVIKNAYDEVMAAIERTCDPEGGASFAFTMLAAGFVARCEDHGHVAGWVPTSDARRLADRVLSLIAADYLARPADYDTDLAVCSTCKTVEFDAVSRSRGICPRHGSGMYIPGQRSTKPYLPEGA